MLLTMDIENTCITLGCFDGDKLCFSAGLSAVRSKTAEEYAIAIRDVLELYRVDLRKVKYAIMSSVVPGLTSVMKAALSLLLGTEPMVVGPGVKTGLNIRMDHPASVGTDLVALMVAAIGAYPSPLVVANLGTATTLLASDEKGSYVGAIIAPGPITSMDALAETCDQLPVVALEAPRDVLGKNTVDSMKSGAVYGMAAMLDGLVERAEAQLGQRCTVVVTGAYAAEIAPHCRREMILDPCLGMKGLRRIFEKNYKK